MSYQRVSLRLAILLFASLAIGPTAFAQGKTKRAGQDPLDKPRNVKPELRLTRIGWKDVAYVIHGRGAWRSRS
jgi:hypothetical protein